MKIKDKILEILNHPMLKLNTKARDKQHSDPNLILPGKMIVKYNR